MLEIIQNHEPKGRVNPHFHSPQYSNIIRILDKKCSIIFEITSKYCQACRCFLPSRIVKKTSRLYMRELAEKVEAKLRPWNVKNRVRS